MSKIDDIFKEGLDQKGLAYSDAHWAGMEALLDKKKKGFFVRYKWYFASLLLLLIVITTYVSWPTAQQKETLTPIALTESNNQNITSNNSSIDLQLKNTNTDKKALKENTTNNDTGPKPTHSKTGTDLIDHSNKKKNLGQRFTENKKNSSSQNASSLPSSIPNSINNSILVIKDVASLPLTKASFMYLKLKDFYLFPAYLSSPILNKKAITIDYPSYKWQLFMAPYIQLSSHNRTIKLRTESELKKQEKPMPAMGFGVNLLAKKGHWVFKSGLQFNQIKERTNYASIFKTQTYDTSFRLVILNFTQTPRVTNVALLETKIDTLIGPSETIINNPDAIAKFNYVTLPVGVQYEWHKKRFLYFVEAGGAVSLLTHAKGIYTINDASKTGQLSDNSSSANKVLFQATGAVGVKYSLTNQLNIWSSYGQNIGLNSMIADYSQKTRIQQFSLGIEIEL